MQHLLPQVIHTTSAWTTALTDNVTDSLHCLRRTLTVSYSVFLPEVEKLLSGMHRVMVAKGAWRGYDWFLALESDMIFTLKHFQYLSGERQAARGL